MMPDLFRDYKPFRNFLAQFEILDSLIHVWRYSLFAMDKVRLPPNYIQGLPRGIDPKQILHAWELDILARELVLNAGAIARHSLQRWNDLATAVNYIRRLDDEAFMLGNSGQPDVLFQLHRIAHRQFPFTDNGIFPIMRAAKILGSAKLDELTKRELGLSAKQFFRLGIAVAGHFNHSWGLSTNQDYSSIQIEAGATRAFFDRLTISLPELKRQLKGLQQYDQDWYYTWNPLELKPLVAFDPENPDRVVCPFPRYLIRRTYGGLFYDLVNVSDFQNPFGASFQAYIGELLQRTCKPLTFSLLAMKPYLVRGETFHGVDWILSDGTGHAFIEAKTKRLTVKARASSDLSALGKDLQVLAEAVAQNYRNIQDAVDGKTEWVPDGLPIYPLVLTLEDWYIFSPRVKEMLDDKILVELEKKGIDSKVLSERPWQLGSAHELEIASQVIAQVGIAAVMGAKTPNQQGWSLLPVLYERFPHEMRNVNYHLFGEDLLALIPEARPEYGVRSNIPRGSEVR